MSWDKTKPDGLLPVSQGDDAIRANFAHLEDNLGASGADSIDLFYTGCTGYLKFPTGTLAARASLTPSPKEGTFYVVNDASAELLQLTRYNGATWDIVGNVDKALLRAAAAVEAERTMAGRLVLAAQDTIITGYDGSGKHQLWHEDAMSEQIAEIHRVGASDYDLYIMSGSSLRKLLAGDDADFPAIAAGDAGKGLKVNAGETAWEHGFPSPDFESSELSLPTSSVSTVAHGKSSPPTLVQAILRCKTINLSYAVGDEVPVSAFGHWDGHTQYSGIVIAADTTNFTYGTSSSAPILTPKSGGASAYINRSYWRLILRGWW